MALLYILNPRQVVLFLQDIQNQKKRDIYIEKFDIMVFSFSFYVHEQKNKWHFLFFLFDRGSFHFEIDYEKLELSVLIILLCKILCQE